MFLRRIARNLRIIPFYSLLLLIGSPGFVNAEEPGDFSPDKVNLAIRRTADRLLRESGDSTSRIPAVEQSGDHVWKLRIEQAFSYEQLPALLQESLDLYNIQRQYEVMVRRCTDDFIDLGFHKFDYTNNNNVPCSGRERSADCHYIEIRFLEIDHNKNTWALRSAILLIVLGGWLGFWYYRKHRSSSSIRMEGNETEWLEFGNSRLDVEGQLLQCGEVRQSLTYREAKLLRLFATNPGRLLERDFILRQVWTDEGVLVGRSMDVFVSRLRKKLAPDPTIGITTVHGVGYRLETDK